ncbi:hypothetical protein OEZ86_003960 [Tetradesmus obliquus]|nr:hypothetical protein OEZ86_003960 [Tetradesmus obliquus]
MAPNSSAQRFGQLEQPVRTTFGRLEGVSECVVLPSTLGYRERQLLQKTAGFEYGKIYNSAQSMGVVDRLTMDASVRQRLQVTHAASSPAGTLGSDWARMTASSTSPCSSCSSSGASLSGARSRSSSRPPSGFVSNNNVPALTRSLHEAAASAGAEQLPLGSLHPITLKSYYKHFPLDFMSAARPQAQTTNQTLRMLGTYSSDAAVAKALGVHVPAGAVKPGFDPDVVC